MSRPTLPPRRSGDRRGLLIFEEPLPAEFQNAEDSTQAADFDARTTYQTYTPEQRAVLRTLRIAIPSTGRLRLTTPTERLLLEAVGLELPPDDVPLYTQVQYLTGTLRRRTWPQLRLQATEKEIS